MGQICNVSKCGGNETLNEIKSERSLQIQNEKQIPLKFEVLQQPRKPQGTSRTPKQIHLTKEDDLDLEEQINYSESRPTYITNSPKPIQPNYAKHRKLSTIQKESTQSQQESMSQAELVMQMNFQIPISQRRLIPSQRQMRQEMYEQRRKESPIKIQPTKKVMFADQLAEEQLNKNHQIVQDQQFLFNEQRNGMRLYGSSQTMTINTFQNARSNYLMHRNSSLSPNGILKKNQNKLSSRNKKVHFSALLSKQFK